MALPTKRTKTMSFFDELKNIAGEDPDQRDFGDVFINEDVFDEYLDESVIYDEYFAVECSGPRPAGGIFSGCKKLFAGAIFGKTGHNLGLISYEL